MKNHEPFEEICSLYDVPVLLLSVSWHKVTRSLGNAYGRSMNAWTGGLCYSETQI